MKISHDKIRAKERYDITLSNKKKKKICRLIESGQCNYLSNGHKAQRKVYGLSFEGKRLRVVYDHYDKKIITFLPNGK